MSLRRLVNSEWGDIALTCRKLWNRDARNRHRLFAVSKRVTAEWVRLFGVTYQAKKDVFEITFRISITGFISRVQSMWTKGQKGRRGSRSSASAGLQRGLQLLTLLKSRERLWNTPRPMAIRPTKRDRRIGSRSSAEGWSA
jgi:hypothetical protein